MYKTYTIMKALSSVTRPFSHVCLNWIHEKIWIIWKVLSDSFFMLESESTDNQCPLKWNTRNLCGLLTILRPPSLMKYWFFLQSHLKLSLSLFFFLLEIFLITLSKAGLDVSCPSVPFRLLPLLLQNFLHFIVIIYGTCLCFTLNVKSTRGNFILFINCVCSS